MFPSIKANRLLAVLMREPLNYRIARQTGSHRKLVSANRRGRPVMFSYHSSATASPLWVRRILVDTVGLDEDEGVGAEVPEAPEWTIVGTTIAEARELVLDGMEFATNARGPFTLHETFEDLRQASGSAVA